MNMNTVNPRTENYSNSRGCLESPFVDIAKNGKMFSGIMTKMRICFVFRDSDMEIFRGL